MRKVSYAIVAILVIIIGLYIWYTHTRTISLSMNTIEYQLGEANVSYTKPVVVRVNGDMWRNWRGLYRFKGTVEVEGENIPIPPEHRKLSLKFNSNNSAIIMYRSVENGSSVSYVLGELYLKPDLSRLAIAKFVSEDGDPNGKSKGWNGIDGFMIAGPASDRESALAVSSEMLKPILQGFTLK